MASRYLAGAKIICNFQFPKPELGFLVPLRPTHSLRRERRNPRLRIQSIWSDADDNWMKNQLDHDFVSLKTKDESTRSCRDNSFLPLINGKARPVRRLQRVKSLHDCGHCEVGCVTQLVCAGLDSIHFGVSSEDAFRF